MEQKQEAALNKQQQTNSQFEQIANEKINEVERITPVGELLEKSFRIFKQGASKFLSMTLLVPLIGMIPLIIVAVLSALATTLSGGPIVLIFQIILGLLVFISILILFYVFIISNIGVYILLRDFSPDLKVKEAFKRARPYFWKLIIVNLFVGIFVILWSLLFIIPGIIVSVYYTFAIWALIFEGYEGTSALKRSKELVKGYWWAVFGRYLAIGLIYIVIISILSIPLVFVEEGSALEVILSIILQVIEIIIGVILAIYSYLIYKDLVKIKGESQVEKKERRKSGKKRTVLLFLLIIIIVIIPIIGFLFALSQALKTNNGSIFTLDQTIMKMQDTKKIISIEQIQAELEVYYEKNNSYPKALIDLENSTSVSEDDYKYTRRGFNDYELCFELWGDAVVPEIILDRNILAQIRKIEGYTIGENCVISEDYRKASKEFMEKFMKEQLSEEDFSVWQSSQIDN